MKSFKSTKPRKPNKIRKPEKSWRQQEEISLEGHENIQELLNLIPEHCDLKEVYLDLDIDLDYTGCYYDTDYCHTTAYPRLKLVYYNKEEIINENYDSDMIKYNKKMEKYNKKMEKYEEYIKKTSIK